MKFAVAQNAAIIEDNGSRVRYHPICPYCGYLHDRLTSSVVVGSGPTSAGSVFCRKCGKSFNIKITRT